MRKLVCCRRKRIGLAGIILVVMTTLVSIYSMLMPDVSLTKLVTDRNHLNQVISANGNLTISRLSRKVPVRTPSKKCQHWFEPTFEENLNVISNYPIPYDKTYMQKIDKNRTKPQEMMTSFPVIVTAASSGFFTTSQGLIHSIHTRLLPKYGDIKIIYYDLGLSQTQVLELQRHCKCEIRTFKFEDFPPHVEKLKTYTWKPIIIKTVLMEYGWVWWMDSSVRFVSDDLDLPLQYSRDNSVLFFTYAVTLSVAQRTDRRTMAYLGEDVCKFREYGMIEATFTLYHFDHVTNVLVTKWVACALDKDCMAPTLAKLSCSASSTTDGHCHRFDQAVLTIMLRRLYHDFNDYPLVENPFRIHHIRRGERISYFREH